MHIWIEQSLVIFFRMHMYIVQIKCEPEHVMKFRDFQQRLVLRAPSIVACLEQILCVDWNQWWQCRQPNCFHTHWFLEVTSRWFSAFIEFQANDSSYTHNSLFIDTRYVVRTFSRCVRMFEQSRQWLKKLRDIIIINNNWFTSHIKPIDNNAYYIYRTSKYVYCIFVHPFTKKYEKNSDIIQMLMTYCMNIDSRAIISWSTIIIYKNDAQENT